MRTARLFVAGLMLAAGVAWSGQSAPDSELTKLVGRLSSASFAEREAAQRELGERPWEDRGLLVTLAGQTADEEAKDRLRAAIDTMDGRRATNPPGITLHLHGALPAELAAALGKELGLELAATGGTRYYTIDVDQQPFWEVYAALYRQGRPPLEVPSQERYLFSQPFALPDQRVGGLVFDAEFPRPTRGRTVQPTGTVLDCRMFADPRITILEVGGPYLTSVVDEAGNVLLNRAAPADMREAGLAAASNGYPSEGLPLPAGAGRKLASIKGEVRVLVQVSAAQAAIEDVARHMNEPVTVGGMRVTVDGIDQPDPGSLGFRSQVRPENQSLPLKQVEYTLLDAAGNRIWTFRCGGGGVVAGVKKGQTPGPFTLLLRVPMETRLVVVPFELKDIPWL